MNKLCKELIGIFYAVMCVACISIGVILLMEYETMDTDQADHFLYCYLSSLLWSLVFGEFFGALFKAYCVWMAQGRRPDKKHCLADFFYWVLTYFPCVSVT